MLHLFNTLTKQIEPFFPSQNKKVTLYVCGITPYDTTHLGHAFTYISFDALVKYFAYKGYEVIYTQNVTDINDRDKDILEKAKEQHTTWQALTKFWTDNFLKNMASLHWTKPTHYLYASEQIPSMIDLIQKILRNGYGYEADGGVYLDISKYKEYGKLSHLSYKDMTVLAKEFEEDIDNPHKRHPLDITLWKPSQPNQPAHIPSFDSPFGKGRPGWHIECSAMALNTLAKQQSDKGDIYRSIDIHGGGIDLIYPHHESEITQSETATGTIPFARFWMHVQIVQKDHEKMSKSKGNLIMVGDLLKKYSANAIRWYLLSHHYRQSWNFDEEKLGIAQGHVTNLEKALLPSSDMDTPTNEDRYLLDRFEMMMDNDLQTHEVLEMVQEKLLKKQLLPEEKKSLTMISKTLGFVF